MDGVDMSKRHKPKYKIGDCIIGRTSHIGDNFPNETVMIEVESARYDSQNGHWIFCGTLEHIGEYGTIVEIYEWDVIRRLK
jgi:hypothetical protein